MAQLESTRFEVPTHPLVADPVARAVLRAILDADVLGIALLRGHPWVHVMVNAQYDRLTGSRSALGRSLDEVVGSATPSPTSFDGLVLHGLLIRVPEVRVDAAEVRAAPKFVSFTYVRALEPERDAIVVMVEDVTREVRQRRAASLLWSLPEEVAEEDSIVGIRTMIERTASAIGADASSFFLLDGEQRNFQGAVIGWDRVRSGFVASVDAWPNVTSALQRGRASVLTRGEAKGGEVQWFDDLGLATSLCVPVCVCARPLGVLFFDFCRIRTFDVIALELVTEIAARCGRTVAQAAEASLHGGDARYRS